MTKNVIGHWSFVICKKIKTAWVNPLWTILRYINGIITHSFPKQMFAGMEDFS